MLYTYRLAHKYTLLSFLKRHPSSDGSVHYSGEARFKTGSKKQVKPISKSDKEASPETKETCESVTLIRRGKEMFFFFLKALVITL